MPRVLDDGTRNPFALQRLKDKLGNRSNASAEVELDGTWGSRLGDEGRGVRTIIDMVAATRLDCVLGSAATMRAALTRAVHHARHRVTFGALLADQPLMLAVLADLAVESEAATLLGMRLAHAVDEEDSAFLRLAVAAAKFWVCKRTPPMVAEALECLGGNGYVEEHGLARLYREAPLNSIWEGSGNVNALDVLRAATREPLAVEALDKELSLARGLDRRVDMAADRTMAAVRAAATADPVDAALGARRLVHDVATALRGGPRGPLLPRGRRGHLCGQPARRGGRAGVRDAADRARRRPGGRRPGSHLRPDAAQSLAGRPVHQLAHDVEMAGVPGVLLDQMQQDTLQRWRPAAVPPVTGRADVGEVVSHHHVTGVPPAGVERV